MPAVAAPQSHVAAVAAEPSAPQPAGVRVADGFGRDAGDYGLTLVDWQGYMANPAAEFTVDPPSGVAGPVHITVTAAEPRLYFDQLSKAGPHGPAKQFDAKPGEATRVRIGLFPAREKRVFDTAVCIDVSDARGGQWSTSIPVHCTCGSPDPVDGPPPYPITVDFSQDRTGFFTDAGRRATFEKAAEDWAFYLATPPLRTVLAGQELTPIFPPTAFVGDQRIANARDYTGFLLYGYGVHTAELRSSGQPSDCGFQTTVDGTQLSLYRSGGVEIETRGNYNMLGWADDVTDDDWFSAANARDTQHDFYSIAHHEIGHALAFNAWYPRLGLPIFQAASRDDQ